jgi:hypothetical protein
MIFSITARRRPNGTRGSFLSWSNGLPNRYFGVIQAPRRAARYVDFATELDSTAMSIALLPMPSTTTFLPRSCSSDV